jgi:Uma2 family endonuclease
MPSQRTYVTTMTVEELSQLRIQDKRTELVRGVLVVREPAGYRHGRVTMNIASRLAVHAERTGVGQVFAAETGFTLARGPDTVRAPDVAFVQHARLPDPEPLGFPEFAPDLAIEVLSPSDSSAEVLVKVADWLRAGTRLVWVIDPERRLARIYRQDGGESLVADDQLLEGEDIVAGFSCSLEAIL